MDNITLTYLFQVHKTSLLKNKVYFMVNQCITQTIVVNVVCIGVCLSTF